MKINVLNSLSIKGVVMIVFCNYRRNTNLMNIFCIIMCLILVGTFGCSSGISDNEKSEIQHYLSNNLFAYDAKEENESIRKLKYLFRGGEIEVSQIYRKNRNIMQKSWDPNDSRTFGVIDISKLDIETIDIRSLQRDNNYQIGLNLSNKGHNWFIPKINKSPEEILNYLSFNYYFTRYDFAFMVSGDDKDLVLEKLRKLITSYGGKVPKA